jgi:hypothetical protein
MNRKKIVSTTIVMILLVSFFGTAAAQTGSDPAATTTPEAVQTQEPGSKFFSHPVVALLSAYFDGQSKEEPSSTVTPVVAETPVITETPDGVDELNGELGPIGKEIAAYHEEGMGFGVLVKLYSMAEASQKACDVESAQECTPVTAQELVDAFKSGTGMGALFKEYGKPAMLGVGHVKQELKKQEHQTEDLNAQNNQNFKNGNKNNNGKGPKKNK